jgi:hypothetical protein
VSRRLDGYNKGRLAFADSTHNSTTQRPKATLAGKEHARGGPAGVDVAAPIIGMHNPSMAIGRTVLAPSFDPRDCALRS